MLINAVCPRCKTSYQVQDELRGRPMRCPQATCRQVFIVGQAEAPGAQGPAPAGVPTPAGGVPPKTSPQGTHVSDVLELLPAEPLHPEPPPLEAVPSAPPDWRAGPPLRRPTQTAPPIRPATQLSPEEGGPRVVAFDAGNGLAPPPVRRDERADRIEEAPGRAVTVASQPHPEEHAPAPRPRRRWVWVVLSLFVLMVGSVAGGYVLVTQVWTQSEEKYAAEADELFGNGQFRGARDAYAKLAENFSATARVDYYRYREGMSELRRQLADSGDDPSDHVEHIAEFVKEHAKGPHLAGDAADLNAAFLKMLVEYANRHADAPTDDAPVKVLAKARPAVEAMKGVKLPKEAKPTDWSSLDQAAGRLTAALERKRRFDAVLAEVRKTIKEPSYQAILDLEALVSRHAGELPELPNSKDVAQAFDQVYDGHLRSVRYVPEPPKKKAGPVQEEDEAALLFDTLVGGAEGGGVGAYDGTVLALVRGVLYALRGSTGEVRWATRVGIDTTALPVRVPARAGLPELVLVLSSDTATLTAFDIDGAPRWRYRLQSPSLGRPVVVDGQAYLATTAGEVHEIELSEGKLLGRYLLGQRLTQGGTREPGSKRLYFAADEGCVYVLDVEKDKRRCATILYPRHPAGALRCEPALIPAQGDDVPGFLVLNEANGLREVHLRVYELPLRGRASRELGLRPPATVEGWTWFRPKQDPEKMVLISDAAVLGLFGIKQAHNRDQALFSWLPGGGQPLAKLLTAGPEAAESPRVRLGGRAEVVQMQGDDLWVLADDHLQRLRLAWGQAVGPRLSPAWASPLELGSPVHASQAREGGAGRTSLIVVSQPPRRSVVWASSVDDETGRLHWQRQLGIVCQGEPVAIPVPNEEPLWLTLDQSGALYALDPRRYALRPGATWLNDGKLKRLADSLDENAEWPPVVLMSADGQSAFVVAAPGEGTELVVRQVTRVAGERRLRVTQGKVKLRAAPAGRPALFGASLLVPLSNGDVARVPAPLPDEPDEPPTALTWRADRAPPDASGFVVALRNGQTFITTDGARGLTSWSWTGNDLDTLEKLPNKFSTDPTLEMKDRIVAPPLLLPQAKPGAKEQVLVADSGGFLSLVEVQPNGALEVRREWDVGGVVTAGPFLRQTKEGARVGCVVDRTRLVWIDPGAAKALWQFKADDSEIVGQPHLVAGSVVVVDQAGRYAALDPSSGKKVGRGHQLRGSVAPVASPVELVAGRALAPLSDGTMLLLGLGPAKGP